MIVQQQKKTLHCYLVTDVLADETQLIVLNPFFPIRIFPTEQWTHAHDGRDNPNKNNHDSDALECPLLNVVDTRHRPIPFF